MSVKVMARVGELLVMLALAAVWKFRWRWEEF